ncbi:alpha-2-antiplasmin-like [Uranotaenia lowii]|uniref:alpha-2-antiplasmin-like n=1 Tax=Uranotaenia lowii TaxID=190385 RepID=UPI0024789666|nr:alpha-2-antiplasmin-like [Uranotaenia lowii]
MGSRNLKSVLLLVCCVSLVNSRDDDLFSSQFTWNMFKAAFDGKHNMAVSPFSARLAMTLLANTVKDPFSQRQLVNKLMLHGSISRARETYKGKLSQLSKLEALKFATRISAIGNGTINPSIRSSLTSFNASLERRTTFDKRRLISDTNRWANQESMGMIKNILKNNDLHPNSRLLLYTTVALKTRWDTQLRSANIEEAPFYIWKMKKAVPTTMMSWSNVMLPTTYNKALEIIALELPFEAGSDLSLLIMMPMSAKGNLSALTSSLNENSFQQLYSSLSTYRVSVKIPSFKINEVMRMQNIFRRMQLSAPFEWSLFEMFRNNKVNLDRFKHGVALDIDAPADDSAGLGSRSTFDGMTFFAERPFVFAVILRSKRFPLIVGTYAYPPSSET